MKHADIHRAGPNASAIKQRSPIVQISAQINYHARSGTHPVNADVLAGYPLCCLACQKCDDGRNVVRLSEAAERVLLRDRVEHTLRLALSELGRVNRSRGDGVDGYMSASEIFSQDARDLLDCTLGGEVA